jgi:nucleoid-associated protein YgaU
MLRIGKLLLCIGLVVLLSGCVLRAYTETKQRVDQNLTTGNQGYLMGNPPLLDENARRQTRKTYVAEVEMASPKSTETKVAAAPVAEKFTTTTTTGNQGYMERSTEIQAEESKPVEPTMVQYTVKKGDTLQKISKHFFGTTKRWHKIYQLNESTIKNPDRIKAGMVLDIPKE